MWFSERWQFGFISSWMWCWDERAWLLYSDWMKMCGRTESSSFKLNFFEDRQLFWQLRGCRAKISHIKAAKRFKGTSWKALKDVKSFTDVFSEVSLGPWNIQDCSLLWWKMVKWCLSSMLSAAVTIIIINWWTRGFLKLNLIKISVLVFFGARFHMLRLHQSSWILPCL